MPRVLVFNLLWVPFVDITALQTFEDAVRGFRQRGVQVLVAGANDRVQRKLARAGVLALLDGGQSFATLGEALRRAAALGQGD